MKLREKILIFIPIAVFFGSVQAHALTYVKTAATAAQEHRAQTIIGEESMDLNYRYPIPSVSSVFKDNILLTFAYMSGKVKSAQDINWDELHKSMSYTITLQPGETFAFHDDLLPEFAVKKVVTTNAHFDASQGFISDGEYYGDGVCHLASLINWAARDAGLSVVAPTNHDFMPIPGIDRQYGTAIYYSPGESTINQMQNLYVTNNQDVPISLDFESNGDTVTVKVLK